MLPVAMFMSKVLSESAGGSPARQERVPSLHRPRPQQRRSVVRTSRTLTRAATPKRA